MTLSSDDTVLHFADLANPHDYARELAERMITSSHEAHDVVALARWVRRFTDLALDDSDVDLAG